MPSVFIELLETWKHFIIKQLKPLQKILTVFKDPAPSSLLAVLEMNVTQLTSLHYNHLYMLFFISYSQLYFLCKRCSTTKKLVFKMQMTAKQKLETEHNLYRSTFDIFYTLNLKHFTYIWSHLHLFSIKVLICKAATVTSNW